MCGISGIKVFKAESAGLLQKIGDSVSTLKKRGPDTQDHQVFDSVALGHARLAIIDLNPRASQPMVDETGRYAIVFNGEIFNYREIRTELLAEGIPFFSESDTEVLLKGFIRWGTQVLDKLNGFFSFCIYDKTTDSLFLARDRFGIKPLVYSYNDTRFLFASEIKALIPFGFDTEIDRIALADYFRFSYVPAPLSMYAGVRKLLPGHFLQISAQGEMTIKRWYTLKSNDIYNNISYEDAKGELRRLIDNSVKRRLVSDVPLGTFLSGGIDSSIVAAAAASFNPDIHSFSIGFSDNPQYDESPYATETAKFLGIKHTTIPVAENELLDSLPDVLDYFGEPFADSSALAVHILCKKVRSHVTVALSGDGGDEQFAGYNKHRVLWRYQNPGLADHVVGALNPLWKMGAEYLPTLKGGIFSKLEKYASHKNTSAALQYAGLASWQRNLPVSETGTSFYETMNRLMPHGRRNASSTCVNDFLYTDMHWVLPNDMLAKVDLMSMANSLEVRVPLLDHTVAEFAFSIPSEYKIDSFSQKKILADAFRDRLPESIFTRKKHGFEVPLGQWFSGKLNRHIEDIYLSDEQINGTNLFVAGTAERIRKIAKRGGSVQQMYPVWAMVVFIHWFYRQKLTYA